jgi:hypothetical protein
MKNPLQLIVPAVFVITAMLATPQITRAQDPVKVDPAYKVLFENKTVRILEYRDTPGHKVPKHSHPNYFVYVISDATRLFTDWNVTTGCTGAGKTVPLTAGEAISKTAITHCEANTGNSDTHLLVVEFKGTSTKARVLHRSKRRH